MSEQKPSVGRIVHVTSTSHVACRPAIVDHVHVESEQYGTKEGMLDLIVFGAPHNELLKNVEHGVPYHPGTWHWPERV